MLMIMPYIHEQTWAIKHDENTDWAALEMCES